MDKALRVVAITGASSGVERATAREFARAGATVGLLTRGQQGLEACAEEVRSLGGRPVVLRTDVADADQVQGAAERLEREHGPIEVSVNNAMATVFGEVRAITAEEYRRVTEVTYLGVVHGTLSALRVMGPRDRGVIVQAARRSRTAASRCRAPTARPSTRSRASASRCAASCSTSPAACARGGHCSVSLRGGVEESSSAYLEDTMVLETTLQGAEASVRVLDFMAIRE